MKKGGYNLGGEQSGHIILSDYSSTGDALVAALAVLAAYVTPLTSPLKGGKEGGAFSKFATRFAAMPQILKNYRLQDWQNADELVAKAQEAATKLQTSLTGQGRVLIRKSGTEPLIRVMAEGQNQAEIENLADNIIKNLK
jgi:phosphoglucosamine mutase